MTAAPAIDKLEHDLTQNALEFLRRSVTAMRTNPDDATFPVVDLAVAVEVLLKARLVREHWSLICKNPDTATPAGVLAGTVNTVSTDQALDRLENVVSLALKADSRRKRLETIGKLRNRAIHFTLTINGSLPIGVQADYGRALDVVMWLLDSEFRSQTNDDNAALVEETIDALTTELGEIDALVQQRMDTIEPVLAAAEVVVECPRCRQPAVPLDREQPVACAFCLWAAVDDTAANEYVEEVLGESQYRLVKNGGEWPVGECVSCRADALVEGIVVLRPTPAELSANASLPCEPPSPPHWGCFGCGMTATVMEIERCSHCNRPTDTGGLCADCFGEVVDYD